MIATRIPFLSLAPSEDSPTVRRAIDRVVASGRFVLGPEVEAFETEFAGACGAPYAVGVGNGTDAIALTLRALGVGPGDEVVTTPLSAAYTALAVMMTGARPVFADIDPVRLTIDPEQIERAMTSRTRAIVPVHLYGQPADMTAIEQLAARHKVAIVEDCCQAHLATSAGGPSARSASPARSAFIRRRTSARSATAAPSSRATLRWPSARRLRNGGQTDRYQHETFGVNSRLDELQAAVLRARLPLLPQWTAQRRALAARLPKSARRRAGRRAARVRRRTRVSFVCRPQPRHARDALQRALAARGIETHIHYPVPIPRQPAFAAAPRDCPVAARVCDEVLSLPLHPGDDRRPTCSRVVRAGDKGQ